MQRFVFATRNHHKIRELEEILGGGELTISALPGEAPEVEETEPSFAGNAALKAISAFQFTGLPSLADDSGICVKALDGAPGVLSARYSGPYATSASNNAELIWALAGIEERAAWYACSLALVCPRSALSPGPLPHEEGVTVLEDAGAAGLPAPPAGCLMVLAEGRVDGQVIDVPAGEGGFGYDPHFWLPSHGCTMAQLPAAEKHAVSHRGEAMRRLGRWLARARGEGLR